MLVRERPRAFGAAGGEGGADRAVLGVVPGVEVVELGAGDPRDLAGERAPRGARDARDVRGFGGLVDDVVEGVVRAHPLGRERRVVDAVAGVLAQACGQLGEAVLGGVERGEPLGGHARRGPLGREPFELGADEERLAQLVAGERADANAAVRLEGDEAERGQPAQRFADRGAADVEALGEQLLAKDRTGGDRAGDDLVLEDDRDVVGLRRIRHQGGVYGASCGNQRAATQMWPQSQEIGALLVVARQLRRREVGAAEAAVRAGEPAAARMAGGVDLAAAVLAGLERDPALALAGFQVPNCR